MEQLIKANKADALKIQKVITNYNKDPSERKTRDYYETRLVKISKLWETFDKRNDELEQYRETNPEQPYFKENFYDNVEKLYEETRDIFEKALADFMSRMKSTELLQDQLKLMKKQFAIMETLQKATLLINEETKEVVSAAYCMQKLKLINEYWEIIVRNHGEIVSMGKTKHEYFEKDIFSGVENIYQTTSIMLQELLNKLNPQEVKNSTTIKENEPKTSQIKLPRVEIPLSTVIISSGNHLEICSQNSYIKMTKCLELKNCSTLKAT